MPAEKKVSLLTIRQNQPIKNQQTNQETNKHKEAKRTRW